MPRGLRTTKRDTKRLSCGSTLLSSRLPRIIGKGRFARIDASRRAVPRVNRARLRALSRPDVLLGRRVVSVERLDHGQRETLQRAAGFGEQVVAGPIPGGRRLTDLA